jgi:hypothetical protein
MRWCALLLAAAVWIVVCAPSRASAYSVLAHEALIDDVWADDIAPLLARRFPRVPNETLEQARAYAYGGSLIHDLGYYPFGSRFFSNVVHYVRSGDFVAALIRESRNVDEYAFALGALAHYASDKTAHPTVNHALPIAYPKLRVKFGDDVLFGDSPARHVMMEFAFDVLQVARGHFKADAYQRLIGFEVARPLLERAFRETYGLELKDLFGDVDLAIGTYRRAASQIIPDVTRVAWREKRDDILAVRPDVTEQDFVYSMTQQEYEETYGSGYRKPGFLVKLVVAIFKIVPKFGPFKPLAFEPLDAKTERMFLDSFVASREQYRQLLRTVGSGRLTLGDTDLDTGKPPAAGVNELADKTYAELIEKLNDSEGTAIPAELHRALASHYAASRASSAGAATLR